MIIKKLQLENADEEQNQNDGKAINPLNKMKEILNQVELNENEEEQDECPEKDVNLKFVPVCQDDFTNQIVQRIKNMGIIQLYDIDPNDLGNSRENDCPEGQIYNEQGECAEEEEDEDEEKINQNDIKQLTKQIVSEENEDDEENEEQEENQEEEEDQDEEQNQEEEEDQDEEENQEEEEEEDQEIDEKQESRVQKTIDALNKIDQKDDVQLQQKLVQELADKLANEQDEVESEEGQQLCSGGEEEESNDDGEEEAEENKYNINYLQPKDMKIELPRMCKYLGGEKLNAEEFLQLIYDASKYQQIWLKVAGEGNFDNMQCFDPQQFSKFYRKMSKLVPKHAKTTNVFTRKEANFEINHEDLMLSVLFHDKKRTHVSWLEFWIYMCNNGKEGIEQDDYASIEPLEMKMIHDLEKYREPFIQIEKERKQELDRLKRDIEACKSEPLEEGEEEEEQEEEEEDEEGQEEETYWQRVNGSLQRLQKKRDERKSIRLNLQKQQDEMNFKHKILRYQS